MYFEVATICLANLWTSPEDGDRKLLKNVKDPSIPEVWDRHRRCHEISNLRSQVLSPISPCLHCLILWQKDSFYVLFDITGVCLVCLSQHSASIHRNT
jgi:hypothetical protein